MPNTSTPRSGRYTGWFNDMVNGKLEYYYQGTLIESADATTVTLPSTHTTTNAGVVNFDGAVDFDSTVNMVGATPTGGTGYTVLGSHAAIASNGAGALMQDIKFVAPAALRITGAWKINQTASDVTVGTATSETSYRRVILVTNTAGTGSGTDIVASLNATASAASGVSRSFSTKASTVPAGAIVVASHLTVGAETADGTDHAASVYTLAYQFV